VYHHEIELRVSRDLAYLPLDETLIQSSVTIDAESPDLIEAWHEVLSRMPSDVYAALKAAMPKVPDR